MKFEGFHYEFEIVDSIPSAYEIWNVHHPDGYYLLCRLKPADRQPFDGCREIETWNLKAIRRENVTEEELYQNRYSI